LVEAVKKKVQWNCFTTASDVVSCGVLVWFDLIWFGRRLFDGCCCWSSSSSSSEE
jgi:hypothetical protein